MTKIAFPQMGDYHIPATYLLSHIYPNDRIIKAPQITSRTIELGTNILQNLSVHHSNIH